MIADFQFAPPPKVLSFIMTEKERETIHFCLLLPVGGDERKD